MTHTTAHTISAGNLQNHNLHAMPKVYVLHDSPEWVTPLARAFDAANLPYEFWYLNEGAVPLGSVPPEGIFYNRIGASAITRGNPFTHELARLTISWLEDHGRRVINTSKALVLELSKLCQYQALGRHGIATPETSAAVGPKAVYDAGIALGRFPLILKPNKGGKGQGVHLIEDEAALRDFVESPEFGDPVDGVWLVQQYIQATEPYITRAEFVGGRFLYTMKVNTSEGFELCPAESCSVADMLKEKFKLTHDFDHHPLIRRLESFLAEVGIDCAGVEFAQDADGELFVYDVNTNTNYNAAAEAAAGVAKGGMVAVTEFLQATLQHHLESESIYGTLAPAALPLAS